MKTITVKLPDEESKELDEYIKKKNYVSKSEFIRNLIMERLDSTRREKMGWLILAEKSMEELWNSEEDKVWDTYV